MHHECILFLCCFCSLFNRIDFKGSIYNSTAVIKNWWNYKRKMSIRFRTLSKNPIKLFRIITFVSDLSNSARYFTEDKDFMLLTCVILRLFVHIKNYISYIRIFDPNILTWTHLNFLVVSIISNQFLSVTSNMHV